jgi:hypothetical protein
MAEIDLGARLRDECVHQVVGFIRETLCVRTPRRTSGAVFVDSSIPNSTHVAGVKATISYEKVNRALRLLGEPERTQTRDHDILQVRLPRVEDVVHRLPLPNAGVVSPEVWSRKRHSGLPSE